MVAISVYTSFFLCVFRYSSTFLLKAEGSLFPQGDLSTDNSGEKLHEKANSRQKRLYSCVIRYAICT